jgi:integrase
MGVHKRKRARKDVYGINFMVDGRQVQEMVGTDKRAAERLHRQRLREVAKGVYVPSARSANISVRRYAELWFKGRTNITLKDDAQRMRDHILPRVGSLRLSEVEQQHVTALVRDLQGSTLSLSTAKNSYRVFRTMMRDATIDKLIFGGDPCVLPRGAWRKKGGIEREVYAAQEAVRLMTDEKLGWDRRVLFALWFYTGGREGEACGLQWQKWTRDSEPLGALAIDWQYDHQPLKTNNPRRVPVHPHLAEILQRWFDEGFELIYGRRPQPTDWIVPRRCKPNHHLPHTKSSAYKAFRKACELLGIEARSLHATRHTMITWARRGGASKDVLEKITHNAKGQIIDAYTHWDWEPLCTMAMLKLDYLGAASARQPSGPALAMVAGPAGQALTQQPGIAPAGEHESRVAAGGGSYVGFYVASQSTLEIVDESGPGAGQLSWRIPCDSTSISTNTREPATTWEPTDCPPFVQVDAGYAAHHRGLELVAQTYLETGSNGEPCAHLALQLAAAVMSEPRVHLAATVLAGGAHVHSRATELASLVLSRAPEPKSAETEPEGSENGASVQPTAREATGTDGPSHQGVTPARAAFGQGDSKARVTGRDVSNAVRSIERDTPEGSGSDQLSRLTVTPGTAYAVTLKRAMQAAIEAEAFDDLGSLRSLFERATAAAGGAQVVELALRRRPA